MTRRGANSLAACLAGTAVVVALGGSRAQAQIADLVDRSELRVCADPSNLPFSNQALEGFENKIAAVLARDLKLPLHYTWFPQTAGFVRNTLRARHCDLVLGTVSGDDIMQNTNAYYYTTYALIYRPDAGIAVRTLGDPVLRGLRIGVIAGTPPADYLVKYDLMERVKPYQLFVDTRFESQTNEMIKDIVAKEIDVGVLWGPIAGYFAARQTPKLVVVPLRSEADVARLEYRITMGVRATDQEWKRQVNELLRRNQSEITAILAQHGVPLLNEQGEAISGR